jgi:hypothetical protein
MRGIFVFAIQLGKTINNNDIDIAQSVFLLSTGSSYATVLIAVNSARNVYE